MTEKRTLTVEAGGNIHLPSDIEEALHLQPGSVLEVAAVDGAELRLRVLHDEAEIIEKQGLLVIRSAPFEDLAGLVDEERKARLSALSGAADE